MISSYVGPGTREYRYTIKTSILHYTVLVLVLVQSICLWFLLTGCTHFLFFVYVVTAGRPAGFQAPELQLQLTVVVCSLRKATHQSINVPINVCHNFLFTVHEVPICIRENHLLTWQYQQIYIRSIYISKYIYFEVYIQTIYPVRVVQVLPYVQAQPILYTYCTSIKGDLQTIGLNTTFIWALYHTIHLIEEHGHVKK